MSRNKYVGYNQLGLLDIARIAFKYIFYIDNQHWSAVPLVGTRFPLVFFAYFTRNKLGTCVFVTPFEPLHNNEI